MKFSEILKDLLKEHNLSQEKLAKSIGFSQRAVSKWVNEQAEPTETAILRCSKFFDISTDELLGVNTFSIKKENSALGFSQDEVNLIKDYRSLAPALQEMLRATIQTWKGTSANTGTKPHRA